MEAEEIAFIRGSGLPTPIRAHAHAELASCYASRARIVGIAAAEIDFHRGLCNKGLTANDHDILAMSWGKNAVISFRDAEAIACSRGMQSYTMSVAKAHAGRDISGW
eukprot:gnl/MRDRNA2_/MRDRNA2_82566_c0_seq3.p1 gnl/MRDRNA2_/MRDRNA2_82566_c0~~gnl/MRDRNA2_/MRDRNA2_82566_c0_seq3.p1  ORF type:complete len:107 (+),score=2.43 gnl/MRDRNA2_/MRDRNA2_82566_c0_seq3:134-454(+)